MNSVSVFGSLLLALTLCCAGTSQQPKRSTTEMASASQPVAGPRVERFGEPTTTILPTVQGLKEYTIAEKAELFVGQELYELINGGAVQFFDHGFRWAAAAGYHRVGGDRVTVHVYRMKSPGAAASIFSERTLGEAVPPVVGDRSSLPGSSFDFCRGACYVTLVSFEGGESGTQSTLALAKAIDAHLLQE